MSTIKIPATIEEATASLTSIDGLVTAKEWSRAAIVFAFTRNDGRGRPAAAVNARDGAFTMKQFADLKVTGLTKRDTVARYRKAWEQAVADGHATEVEAGQKAMLPDVPWADYYTTLEHPGYQRANSDALILQAQEDEVGPSKVIDIAKNPKAMAAAIKADPALAAAAADAILAAPDAIRSGALEHLAAAELDQRVAAHKARQEKDELLQELPERVRRDMGRKLGHDTDQATDYINGAANDLAHAVWSKERWGIDYPDEEAKAIAKVKHWLAMYERAEGAETMSDDDRDFLASIGIGA